MRRGRVRRSPWTRWIRARSASGHRDAGSAMILAVLATAAAAGVGAMAVAAVARSITAEDRTRRQEVVDLLAVSGAEEALGRIVSEGFGLSEITGSDLIDPAISAHPAFGEEEDRSLGPWARFDEVGRVVPCGEDATAACYTLRLLTDTDIPDLTDPFGPAPQTVIIDVTARQCQAPDPASARCARARVQTTVVAREFLTEFETTTSSAVPDGDEMRSLAGLVLEPDSEATPSVSVSGSTLSATGAAGVTEAAVPVNRVVFVEGDLEITAGDTRADPTLDLTVVASGSITISGDVLSGGLFAIVATGGEILITADVETVEALLIANTPEVGAVEVGAVELTEDEVGDFSLGRITGAVVTREFVIPESDSPPELVFDPRLERLQPPFALEQVRGVWLRVDQVAVAPGS